MFGAVVVSKKKSFFLFSCGVLSGGAFAVGSASASSLSLFVFDSVSTVFTVGILQSLLWRVDQ